MMALAIMVVAIVAAVVADPEVEVHHDVVVVNDHIEHHILLLLKIFLAVAIGLSSKIL